MKKIGHRRRALIIILALVITAALGLVVIFLVMNQKQPVKYWGMTLNGRPYELCLQTDGTFDFIDMASSTLQFHNEEDRYRWSDDMLVLEFTDSEKVWYLRREGDSLVFEESLSGLVESDPRLKGVVFEKVTY